MNIENKIRKRIKTMAIVNHEYPKEIEISQEEWNQLNKIDKFEGVKLICKNYRVNVKNL